MLLRQTLLYLPAQALGPIVQFVSIILWTYFLDPTEMGVFALITAAQELGYVATMFWFTLYTMRYFDKTANDTERRDFLNTESAVMSAAVAATAIATLSMPWFVDATWDTSLIWSAVAYCVSRTIATHLSDRARTAADTLTYSVLQISWPVLGLLLGILCVKVMGAKASSVLWGYAAAQAIALAYAALRLEFGVKPIRFSREKISVGLSYGLPLVAGGIFVWLANNGLRFVIEHMEGAAAVGLVTVGWGLGLRAAAFAAMLVTAAAFPLAVSRAREGGMAEGQMQLVRNGILLLAVLAPAAAGLWAISTPLVERLVAEPFREMTAAVLPWAIIAGAARNLRIHFGEQVFLLREETRVPLVNDVIDGLAAIAGGAIGLVLGGLPGSVMGAAVGAIASLVITLACGAIWHNFTMPLADLAKIALATVAMVWALQFFETRADLLSLLWAVIVGGCVYALVLAAAYPAAIKAAASKLRPQSLGQGQHEP